MLAVTVLVLSASTGAPVAVAPRAFAQGQPHPLQPSSPRIDRLVRAPGVIEGTLTDLGMIGWNHLIEPTQAESIRAYVGRQAVVLRNELAAAAAVPANPSAAAGTAERR